MGSNKFSIRKRCYKKCQKVIKKVALDVCMLEKKKNNLLMFQNITQIVKNKLFF